MRETLVLGNDGGGDRHYLAGRAVHCGAAMELELADGRWLRGRYEISGGPPSRGGVPIFVFGHDAAGFELQLIIGRYTPLRWPENTLECRCSYQWVQAHGDSELHERTCPLAASIRLVNA